MKKLRPKLNKWMLIGIPISIALVVVVICHDTIVDSLYLHQIVKTLASIPSPPNSEVLNTHSAVGLLVGNGNHLDFFVGTLFRSDATIDSVRQHYAGRVFFNPITAKQEQFEVAIVTNLMSFSDLYLPDEFYRAEKWNVSEQTFATGTVFLVSMMRSYRPNNDLRF